MRVECVDLCGVLLLLKVSARYDDRTLMRYRVEDTRAWLNEGRFDSSRLAPE